MAKSRGSGVNPMFKRQTEKSITPTLTQNVWVTLLDVATNVRLYGGSIRMATNNETIEIRITVDGVVLTSSTGLTANTVYELVVHHDIAGTILRASAGTNLELNALGFPYDGRSIKIEVRKTTATGAGVLTMTMDWARRV